ncbi:MAG: lipid-A-disaccharide synthase [Planctomycetaceae bacterium]|jgi:lipid-A-disaccharide synthase|nr:lipid-A-disaccharide synthase [Planctomycetaceae bacterium]
MKLFFSAGEPSGDVHAASLITKIRESVPDAEFIGFGGPMMNASGCRLLADMTRLSVMWIWEVFKRYFDFKQLVRDAENIFVTEKIDAIVLVDFPGFNWHIAKAANKCGIPVIYFMPPQLWAWAQWRVKKMQKYADIVLCALPFEYRWFRKNGCRAVYIGHPFFEEIRRKESDSDFLEYFYTNFGTSPVLTLLAGSRIQEIEKNFDAIVDTVRAVKRQCPKVLPVFAALNDEHRRRIEFRLKERGWSIPVFAGRTTELIRAAECCLAVSGSVSLELLACNKPTVIYYKVGYLPLLIQRFFRRTRYITLVNLLSADRQRDERSGITPVFYPDSVSVIPAEPAKTDKERMLFPEFLTASDRTAEAAEHLIRWFSNPMSLARHKERLEMLRREADDVESPLAAAAQAVIDIAEPLALGKL